MVRNTLLCRSSRDRCHIEFSWYSIVPECNTIFLAFTQTFLLHRDIVDTANGRQNRHYFPILCIFTQALVDLTNNSQVFSLTLSRIFHLLAKKWLKKVTSTSLQTPNRQPAASRSHVWVKICDVICLQRWGSKQFLWLLSFWLEHFVYWKYCEYGFVVISR